MPQYLRNYKVQHMRALAIITVVFGHSIIIYSKHWNLLVSSVKSPVFDFMKSVINCYQMELWFFISGFLMYQSVIKDTSWFLFAKEKAKRLIVPYFVIGLFWMIPIKMLMNIPSYQDVTLPRILILFSLGQNNGHLWFLMTLFWMLFFLYPINKILLKSKHKYMLLIVINVFFCSSCSFRHIIPYNYFNLTDVVSYAFAFQLGFTSSIAPPKNWLFDRPFWYLLLWTISCLPLAFIDLARFCGIWFVLVLFLFLPDRDNGLTAILDKCSFGIYLLHSPLIYISFTLLPNIHPLFMLLTNFVLLGGLTFFLTVGIKHSSLNQLLKI